MVLLFTACHGGSATDCTTRPMWSQIVHGLRSSCDLPRFQTHAGPTPHHATTRESSGHPGSSLPKPHTPAAPSSRRDRRRPRRGGDPRSPAMGDASVLMTKALACSERAAGLVDPPPPGRSIHVRARTPVLFRSTIATGWRPFRRCRDAPPPSCRDRSRPRWHQRPAGVEVQRGESPCD